MSRVTFSDCNSSPDCGLKTPAPTQTYVKIRA